jgi:hypothetical protein
MTRESTATSWTWSKTASTDAFFLRDLCAPCGKGFWPPPTDEFVTNITVAQYWGMWLIAKAAANQSGQSDQAGSQ